jgi:hypothetical protein
VEGAQRVPSSSTKIIRIGLLKACIAALKTKTQWKKGDRLTPYMIDALVSWLRDTRLQNYRKYARTDRPSKYEAWAAAQAFARYLSEADEGRGGRNPKDMISYPRAEGEKNPP